jgi:hypothetical protein
MAKGTRPEIIKMALLMRALAKPNCILRPFRGRQLQKNKKGPKK